jgi:nuclear pore complex protein Nup205
MCQYPGLTRGLVAVLLYYDGRKSLIQALRTLIQGRSGVTWTLGASEDITDLITKYTQSLLDDGLVDKILVQLKTNDWSKESMLLQKNLALGDAKHRRQVFDLFGEIRQGLADCIFAFAAQSGLPKTDVIRIIDHLSRVKAGDSNAIGTIDDVNMTLTMGLLYSIDAGAINKCPDGEDSLQSLPLLSDPAFLVQVHRELSHSNRRWEHTAIQSLAQFAWSMTLATVRSLMTSANLEQGQQAVVDDDELVLDAALDNGVFHWLCQSFLDSPLLKTEEFYRRRLHQLLTDLIVLMPLKVKELRNRADEAARNKLMHEQEGVQYSVPLAGQHFENLLAGLTKLYANDDLGLGLVLDFWCPSENIERLPQRQVSLYKFVRLAGDLLMPSLYTPYVDLLVSLSGHPQAALHCFNLLKLNGGQGGCSTVAWDHFFASLHQYFANLRQESHQMPASAMDSIYRRQMTRGISPTEVQGLASVLKLITVVCNHSEAARIAVAEHTNWQPTLVMVGLLSCAVPTVLKAEILNTLTALGKTSEVAFSIWQSIEAAQLITTVPTTSQQRPQGLWTELEDIEARNEEYPLTRSWLRLIDGLTEHGLPHGLGQGTRVPGFAPYFTFIREQIFFRFSTRAYKRPLEKWEIGSLVLKLMVKLLKDYEPTASDFAHKQHTASFQIMVQLLQSSEILRLLLFILDEAVNLLDTYQDFAGKLELEECSLYILRLLATGLKLQDSMLEAARQANTSLILTSLSKLLLAINPRSGKPDHLLNVVKFVTYAWRLPNHGLHAIEVIRGVANQSAMAQTAILATFRTSEAIANDIIKGFTDVLDNDEDEHEDGEEDVVDDIRLAAVDLLLDSLNLPGPTLTHFLLGFNLQKGISKSTIQPPGVLGAVRSPFHAILSLLRPTASGETSPSFERTPNLVVASMKLIYSLCSNLATSEVTLRFLRSSEDFLCTQVSLLPFGGCSEANKTQVNRATAWLLKAVAIEVKMLCQTRQRSQVARLSSLFLDATEAEQNVNYANYLTQLSRSSVLTTASHQPRNQGGQSQQHRLLTILESIDFAEEAMKPPSYEVFDPSQVDQVLKQCHVAAASTTHGGQHRMVDIKSLHKVLNTELASLQNSTANGLGSQRSLIQEEIKLILSYAVQWNGLQERSTSRRNLLDSWRQVAEMLLCTMPEVLVTSVASKQHLLLELLQMLLNKVSADNAMLEMTNQVSGVVLVLMASLRQTYGKTKKTSEDGGGGRQDAYVTILDDTTRIISSASSRLYSAALQAILKGLVMWIVGTSAAAQRVRANLYGALLSYLRIGKANKTSAEKNKANSDEERLKKANLEVLLGYGDSFLDIVCRDSVSGHEIRRMLALSLLDELVRLEGRGAWLYYLSKQGYLRYQKHVIIMGLGKNPPRRGSMRCMLVV